MIDGFLSLGHIQKALICKGDSKMGQTIDYKQRMLDEYLIFF
jgi:hypothetical protein